MASAEQNNGFARTFGNALRQFIEGRNITQAEAAKIIQAEKATLNTYFRDNRSGRRAKANAEVLVEACIQLGFQFEYKGHLIAASKIEDATKILKPSKQLSFDYENKFDLADDSGTVSVSFKSRPSGRVELSVSLKAAS